MGKILIEKSGIFTEISGGTQDTPQQLLAKILTVDGKGSGLDADLLGGVNYSQYALKKDYYDRNIINTELSKKLNISDYNNEKSTFALKTELLNSNKPVYVVSDTEPTDKNVFWIKDEEDPTENVDKSLESLKKSTNSNLSKIQLLENELQTLKSKLETSNSSSTTLSQPRPNLLLNGNFSFCRTAHKNGALVQGFFTGDTYVDSNFDISSNKDNVVDGWFSAHIYTNNPIECSISQEISDFSDNNIELAPKYLKINKIPNNHKRLFLFQSLFQIDNFLSKQKENNLDFVISGIIKQKDLDFDYDIYLLYNHNFQTGLFTESKKVKLDKEYIDNTGKTPIKINYNVFENINLKLNDSTNYDLGLIISIISKDNTNNFSKTTATNPIMIGNLKLELVNKNEEKIPTLFSYYNNSFVDEDSLLSKYWIPFKGTFYSQLCSDNKHRLSLFFNNGCYCANGTRGNRPVIVDFDSPAITQTSVNFICNSAFTIKDYYMITDKDRKFERYLLQTTKWN